MTMGTALRLCVPTDMAVVMAGVLLCSSGTAVGPALETIETSGRQALAETRRLLGVLRDTGEETGLAAWGRQQYSQPLPVIDALIAATAQVHGMTVVTRNVRDFELTGVQVLNPFTG